MALIPLEPEPQPHRFRFLAVYIGLLALSALCGAALAWWQA